VLSNPVASWVSSVLPEIIDGNGAAPVRFGSAVMPVGPAAKAAWQTRRSSADFNNFMFNSVKFTVRPKLVFVIFNHGQQQFDGAEE
jgi:hypothetical protein